MKNHHKIFISLFLFAFISLIGTSVSVAQSLPSPIKVSGDWAMSISTIENELGTKKDGKIKITAPTKSTTYVPGDTIRVTWTSKEKLNYPMVILLNTKGENMAAAIHYDEPKTDTSYDLLVTDDFPTGEYSIYIADELDPATFDLSKSFKIKTNTKPLEDSKFTIIAGKNSQPTSGSAYDKASRAVAMSHLSSARAYAELYYDAKGDYADVCKKSSKENYGIYTNVTEAAKAIGAKANCDSSAKAWAAEVKLKAKEGYYCVDSTGKAAIQKKTKGGSATGCDGSKDKTKSAKSTETSTVPVPAEKVSGDAFLKKVTGLKKSYAPSTPVSFAATIVDAAGKTMSGLDGYQASAYVWSPVDSYNSPNVLGQYDANSGQWNFHMLMPSEVGEYQLETYIYCTHVSAKKCSAKNINGTISKNIPITIKGKKSNTGSLVQIVTPNGGEKITNTGSVNFGWTTREEGAYAAEFFLMPSSDTPFTLINPREGIRGHYVGGSGSPYPTSAYQNVPWSIGSITNGKYKLRVYLYKYRDNFNYSLSEAIAMDESDGYFTIDTSNSNSY